MDTRPDYVALIIRMWREPSAGDGWVVQVEHIATGDQRYITSMDALFTYIRLQLFGRVSESSAGPAGEDGT